MRVCEFLAASRGNGDFTSYWPHYTWTTTRQLAKILDRLELANTQEFPSIRGSIHFLVVTLNRLSNQLSLLWATLHKHPPPGHTMLARLLKSIALYSAFSLSLSSSPRLGRPNRSSSTRPVSVAGAGVQGVTLRGTTIHLSLFPVRFAQTPSSLRQRPKSGRLDLTTRKITNPLTVCLCRRVAPDD